MSIAKLRARHALIPVLLLTMASAACRGPAAYRAPVTKFRDSSAVMIAATKVYLTTLNKTERDHYIYQQVSQRQQIQLTEIKRVQVFSDEGIAARLSALDQLSNYTDLLYQLANSDAPASVKGKVEDLQGSLNNLADETAKLSGADDAKFKSVTAKVFPILGEILQAFLEKKIEDAIKLAVEKGTQPVNDLIEAVKVDMVVAYERSRQAFSARRTAAVMEYNREFEKGKDADPDRLRALADTISANEDRAEALHTAQPGEGLDAMKKANEALAKFARTAHPSIHDFGSFVDAIESFASTAKRIGDAVQLLKA